MFFFSGDVEEEEKKKTYKELVKENRELWHETNEWRNKWVRRGWEISDLKEIVRAFETYARTVELNEKTNKLNKKRGGK